MESKKCAKCLDVKKVEFFGFNKSRPDGLQGWCKQCRKDLVDKNKNAKSAYDKARREEQGEKLKLQQKEWRESNKSQLLEKKKEYYKLNKSRLSGLSKARRERLKSCPIEKAKLVERTRRRQAAKIQRTPEWLNKDHHFMIKEIYELSQLRCDATGVKHHVDHIVPLRGEAVSGLHVPWNLRVITANENWSKSNKVEGRKR